jgi:hypothetical protein
MTSLVIFILAAVAFGVLATVIETRWARQARRQLIRSRAPVLHPMPQHEFTWLRPTRSRRTLRHVLLVIGFLLVAYVGVALVETAVTLVAHWFS